MGAGKARLPLLDRVYGRTPGLRAGAPYTRESVRVPTRDGARLAADHYAPSGEALGTLLVRGPYGRGAMLAMTLARVFAARGYHVLFASSRGTAGSEGAFDPMRTEAADGQDTVAWMRGQEWYTGSFGMVGMSYLGHVQWALLSDPPSDLAAAVVTVGPHDFARHAWGTGTFNLDLVGWTSMIDGLHSGSRLAMLAGAFGGGRGTARLTSATPVADAALSEFGERQPWLRERLLRPDLSDPYWSPMRHGVALERAHVPILIVSGWQDIFARQSHEQYQRLAERGVDVALTVGPWTHTKAGGKTGAAEALQWLDAKLARRPGVSRDAPVHVYVTGAGQWRRFQAWPPAGVEITTMYPSPGGGLSSAPAADGVTAGFTYDPADPTPTVGGPLLSKGGYTDDTALAARGDVLSFTGPSLEAHLEIMGTAVAVLSHRSETGDADLFVRLSDVDPRGRSRNVTEGYLRVLGEGRRAAGDRVPGDGVAGDGVAEDGVAEGSGGDEPVRVELLPAAHRFAAGHRIRLLIAGGSFPKYARNPGTGENPVTAAKRVANQHTLTLGESRLDLPVSRGQ